MSLILDTDLLSLIQRRRSIESLRLKLKLAEFPQSEIATTIITFEEQMRGWLSFAAKARKLDEQLIAYSNLKEFLEDYRKIIVLDFDEKAAKEFQQLKALKLRVGTMDLKIAAIALANDALLLSRNLRDFENIPNLKVEDWTIEQAGENQ